jgi:hypothetical protein
MSPQEAKRLVGHDIVDELRGHLIPAECDSRDDAMARAADEIDRLRTALRAVRACTDPQWQAQLISDALREGEGT